MLPFQTFKKSTTFGRGQKDISIFDDDDDEYWKLIKVDPSSLALAVYSRLATVEKNRLFVPTKVKIVFSASQR